METITAIGSLELAQEIAGCRNAYEMPAGWVLAGTGTTRTAFIGPDGFVYKVARYPNSIDNLSEAYAYECLADTLQTLSNGRMRLARSHYFYDLDVIVMELSEPLRDISGEDYCDLMDWGFGGDLHPGNVWVDKEGVVLIDYGYIRRLRYKW